MAKVCREDRVLAEWVFQLADEVKVADPEIPEETEAVARVNRARLRTSAEVAVVGAEEGQEVQGTQAGQETQEDPVALEALTEAEGEIHKAQCNISWLFAWKG